MAADDSRWSIRCHSGGWAGYVSHVLIFPQQRFAVSVLCNRNDASPTRFTKAIADIYLAEEMRRSFPTVPMQMFVHKTPEPASAVLLLAAVGVVGVRYRRRGHR